MAVGAAFKAHLMTDKIFEDNGILIKHVRRDIQRITVLKAGLRLPLHAAIAEAPGIAGFLPGKTDHIIRPAFTGQKGQIDAGMGTNGKIHIAIGTVDHLIITGNALPFQRIGHIQIKLKGIYLPGFFVRRNMQLYRCVRLLIKSNTISRAKP